MKEKHRDDLALVTAVVGGDRAAWQQLVQRHRDDIHYALLRALQCRGFNPGDEILEDLEADLMLTLAANHFRRLRSYGGRSSLRQWLKVVAGHYAIDFLRRQRPTVPLSTLDEQPGGPTLVDPAPGPHQRVEQRELREAFVELVAQLNAEDRLFVELYYRRELSFERVAQMMGTTVGAIYARKNRLRKRLRKLARRAELV